MVFSSMIFLWIFFPICLVGNYITTKIYKNNNLANIFLLVLSIIFYAWGEPVYIFLMMFSILVNWLLGIGVERFSKNKKIILMIGVSINLLLLGYFKYAGMLVDMANAVLGTEIKEPEIALPIGISFFTFQALSYVIDVYRGECKAQTNLFKLALYVSFFPQLIAGPIVKYKDVNEQIDHRTLSIGQTAEGIRRFCYGLGKKVLISNVLAAGADAIYAMEISEITSIMAWLASLLYTFQIYYDFSGYSDMAIGIGKMLGFEFKENFNYPYTSFSIREFWRRWHISLSSWFKEYVYIPLGGNRKGVKRTYINLGAVFLLTGIWHGADVSFVLWGLYHGFFNVIERLGFEKILKKSKVFSWIYTFMVVNIGWIFFRTESTVRSIQYILRMFMPWKYVNSNFSIWELMNGHTVFALLCAILGMGVFQRLTEGKQLGKKWKYSIGEITFCVCLLLFSIFSLASNTYNPFIYFRF